jgi:hypothetical protein
MHLLMALIGLDNPLFRYCCYSDSTIVHGRRVLRLSSLLRILLHPHSILVLFYIFRSSSSSSHACVAIVVFVSVVLSFYLSFAVFVLSSSRGAASRSVVETSLCRFIAAALHALNETHARGAIEITIITTTRSLTVVACCCCCS